MPVVAGLPGAHLLQSWQWGQEKARLGWQPLPFTWQDDRGQVQGAALILQRTIAAGGFALHPRLLYVPKGPLLDWRNPGLRAAVLDDLQAFARRQQAIFIKIDPDVLLGFGVPGSPEAIEDPNGQAVAAELRRARGWRFSDEQVQFRNTVLIDLAPGEEELLGRMKQKTRYNIRLAQRKGVAVRPAVPGDLEMLYRMYAETSVRDGFVIRDRGVLPQRMEQVHADGHGRAIDRRSRKPARGRRGHLPLRRAGLVFTRHVAQPAPRMDAQLPPAVGGHAPGQDRRLHQLRSMGRTGRVRGKRSPVGRLPLQRGLQRRRDPAPWAPGITRRSPGSTSSTLKSCRACWQ